MKDINGLNKILLIILLSLIVFNIVIWTPLLYIKFSNNLQYISSNIKYISNDYVNCPYEKQEIRDKLNALFGNHYYKYKEEDIQDIHTSGYSQIPMRIMIVKPNLSNELYTQTIAHELVHLMHYTCNERYCNFTAFKILYESGDNYFRYVALTYANWDFNGNIPYSYSCVGYIEQYLKER